MSQPAVHDAPGSLTPFVEAEVLAAAEIHLAGLVTALWEVDDTVRLATALAVRALRGGSVCVDITSPDRVATDLTEDQVADLPWPSGDDLRTALTASPAVALGPIGDDDRPLRLVGDLLYLQRYWAEEESVRDELDRRQTQVPVLDDMAGARAVLDRLFDGGDLPADEPDLQRLAAAMTLASSVTVLAGGPGTGKTTTVAKILALLTETSETPPVTALAAPTGKAAARLEEAVRGALAELDAEHLVDGVSGTTIHRLLGGYRRFDHDRWNPLPHDVVVVDEMSMVSLSLMAKLLEAVRPGARLLLVGDPDQLTSVEAGAVMADMTRAQVDANPALQARVMDLSTGDRPKPPEPRPGVVTLTHTWRFGEGIDAMARAIREGDADALVEVLRSGDERLSWLEVDAAQAPPSAFDPLRDRVVAAGAELHALAVDPSPQATLGALDALDAHRLLCAHRHGPHGVATWERRVEDWLREAVPGYGVEGEWYPGRPLMATANDRDANLYNGDTGVLVRTEKGLRGAFARGSSPALYSTIQLDSVVSVHAMTVHKSQGSQFSELTFVVPPETSPLLTRELVYTAVTRAREHVHVIGTEAALRRAVERPANRASGLARPR
ncbi:exodeoxyribonuclease V subunit alpha [Mariniluteicoccus endophyticus]